MQQSEYVFIQIDRKVLEDCGNIFKIETSLVQQLSGCLNDRQRFISQNCDSNVLTMQDICRRSPAWIPSWRAMPICHADHFCRSVLDPVSAFHSKAVYSMSCPLCPIHCCWLRPTFKAGTGAICHQLCSACLPLRLFDTQQLEAWLQPALWHSLDRWRG